MMTKTQMQTLTKTQTKASEHGKRRVSTQVRHSLLFVRFYSLMMQFSSLNSNLAILITIEEYIGRTVYKGNINKFGQRHGEGKCVWNKGTEEESVYEGFWAYGNAQGEGSLRSRRGSYLYRGSFIANKRELGVQVWTESRVASYRGDWHDDKPHGLGIMVSDKNDKYA